MTARDRRVRGSRTGVGQAPGTVAVALPDLGAGGLRCEAGFRDSACGSRSAVPRQQGAGDLVRVHLEDVLQVGMPATRHLALVEPDQHKMLWCGLRIAAIWRRLPC